MFSRVSLFRRLMLSFWHRRILGRNRWRVIVMDGVKYRMQFRSGDRRMILDGGIEREQFRRLAEEIRARRCEIFLDIGANIGAFALRAAKENLCGEIFAIEGSPRNFARLREHIALNNLCAAVKPVCAVVSDAKRKARFYEANAFDNGIAGLEGSIPDSRGEWFDCIEVDTIPLDELFDFRGRRIAIKIDVEGHELSLLKGARQLLSANDIVLQVEVWSHNGATIEYLVKCGFHLTHFIPEEGVSGGDFFFHNFQGE